MNVASGSFSIVPGGNVNTASGYVSFAAGWRAKARGNGSFVWADTVNADFVNPVGYNNIFAARATGGVQFTVGVDANLNPSWSCIVQNGNAGWSCTSDRNAKENFAAVDTATIMAQVAALPLFTWNGIGADPRDRHLGPTAPIVASKEACAWSMCS